MPRLSRGHHRHLPDEGERQQREHEHRHETSPHDLVLPSHGDARCELLPASRRLCPPGGLGNRRQRHHQQRTHYEQVRCGVGREDPGRSDERIEDPADDRADDPGRVHLSRVERDRTRQVLVADEPGEDGRIRGTEHGAAAADQQHHDDEEDVRRVGRRDDERHAQGGDELFDGQDDQEALAVHLVGQEAADHRQQERRAQLGEDDDADERARVGQVVRVHAEDDVLHPGADVRGEGAQEHDAERPVRQRGPGRAPARRERAVPVDDGVLDLLEGDGLVSRGTP